MPFTLHNRRLVKIPLSTFPLYTCLPILIDKYTFQIWIVQEMARLNVNWRLAVSFSAEEPVGIEYSPVIWT